MDAVQLEPKLANKDELLADFGESLGGSQPAMNGTSNNRIEESSSLSPADANQRTPLMTACSNGETDVAEFLIDLGANIDAATKTGETALTFAAECGKQDVVELLIQRGANVNAKDENGLSALSKAEAKGHGAIAAMLKSAGAAC